MKDDLVKKYFLGQRGNIPSIRRYPDLLVHEYNNLDHQLLAVEIKKRFNTSEILKDLSKLVVFCKGNLKYEKGILILLAPHTNQNLIEVPDIRKLLKKYPMIEIWIIKRKGALTIINHLSLN